MRVQFKHDQLMLILRVLEIVILTGGLWIAIIQLRDLRHVNAGQIALEITRDIYSTERYPQNPTIIRLLERNQPILKENGGPLEDEELDNLLGEWGTVENFNQVGILPDDLVYEEFSFDIQKAYQNNEVQSYITTQRTKYQDQLIFADFENLGQWVVATSNNSN